MRNQNEAPAATKLTGATEQSSSESLFTNDTTYDLLLDGYPSMGTPEDVASFCQLKPDAVRQMCREGSLRAVKFGALWRIHRKWLAEYIAGGGEHDR